MHLLVFDDVQSQFLQELIMLERLFKNWYNQPKPLKINYANTGGANQGEYGIKINSENCILIWNNYVLILFAQFYKYL